MFGFTDEEVKQICIDYHHPEKYAESKEWYDGYRFGAVDIYNPLSILKYVSKGFVPGTYWVNTADFNSLRDVLSHADSNIYENLKIIGSGGTVTCPLQSSITFEDLYADGNAVYSLLVMTGYLTATRLDDSEYTLSIPNKEVYIEFEHTMMRIVSNTIPAT